MITPEQCRAGRAWVDWSQEELAAKAQVSLSTVRDFEKGRRTPIANNLDAIKRALREAGIVPLWVEPNIPFGISLSPEAKRELHDQAHPPNPDHRKSDGT